MLKFSVGLWGAVLAVLFFCGLTPIQALATPNVAENAGSIPSIAEKTKDTQKLAGYFNLYWDAKAGKIWLEIDKWGTEFLYQTSLPAGVGSNDIGWIAGRWARRGSCDLSARGRRFC
jgi:hypothetical protein